MAKNRLSVIGYVFRGMVYQYLTGKEEENGLMECYKKEIFEMIEELNEKDLKFLRQIYTILVAYKRRKAGV